MVASILLKDASSFSEILKKMDSGALYTRALANIRRRSPAGWGILQSCTDAAAPGHIAAAQRPSDVHHATHTTVNASSKAVHQD